MEKTFVNANTLTTKEISHYAMRSAPKIDDHNYRTIFMSKLLPQEKKINFLNPLKRTAYDMPLTGRKINEENKPGNPKLASLYKNIIEPKTKINFNWPGHRRLFNANLKRNYELNKNKSFGNTSFKSKSESIQSDFHIEENKEKKITGHQNSIIQYLLNQKMKVGKPKLKKIKICRINLIERMRELYGEKIFYKKYEKKFLQDTRPIQYYLIDLDQKKKFRSNKSDMSTNTKKSLPPFVENKNIYETIAFGDRTAKVATKLIINENNKNEENFDAHSIMKLQGATYNNSIYSSYSYVLNNLPCFAPYYKTRNKRYFCLNNSGSKDGYKDLKLLSQKGFEKMKKRRNITLNRKIEESIDIVRDNRKKYDSLLELNEKLFNKNKEEILNNKL